ncbi:MAG: lytic transglycosylase domain-containing protein [Bacteroidia bacterium]|nr:lytic transglycosylase domain-containing protein [Bacteroidia bacterium]
MKNLAHIAIPLGLLCGGVQLVPEPEEPPATTPVDQACQDYRFVSNHLQSIDDIPRNFQFGDQLVPVNDERVRLKLKKQINKFSKYSYGNRIIKQRMGRYENTFRRILREHGIPEDFVYLAITESNLRNAISPVGAKGFWQFMPATARQYGLEVSATVDERYDPEKATHAAAKYLTDSYEEFEDWFLVAAAYNMGPYGVMKQMRKQDACSYFDLKLNRETGQYVYKILAYKAIFNQPFKYGTEVSETKLLSPLKTEVVYVDKNIGNLSKFAAQHGTDLENLRAYNPWLIANSLRVKEGKTYRLRIPLDENLRVDELMVDIPKVKKETEEKSAAADSTLKAESLVQEKGKAVAETAQDSSKQV